MKGGLAHTGATKIAAPALLAVILFAIAIFGFILPYFHNTLIERKKETLRELTAAAVAVMDRNNKLAKQGTLSLAEAKARSVAEIKMLRYGQGGKDYFWINDLQDRMIMHPYRPDLVGKKLTSFKDPGGKLIFAAIRKAVAQNGQGYVPYTWQRRDKAKDVAPKLSHVRLFKPWGWVVGTGLYLDDVRRELDSITDYAAYVMLGVLAVLALILFYTVRQSINSTHQKREAEEGLAQSETRYRSVVEQVPCGIFIVRPSDGRFVFLNNSACALFGYTQEEGLALTIWRVTDPSEHQIIKERLAQHLAGEKPPGSSVYSCQHKDGSRLYCEVKLTLVSFEGETALQGILQDITQIHLEALAKARRLERIQQQRETLLRAATHPSVSQGEFQAALNSLLPLSAGVLRCELAALWLIEREAGRLACPYSFAAGEAAPLDGRPGSLALADLRPYLDRLEKEAVLSRLLPGLGDGQGAPPAFGVHPEGGACLDAALRAGGELVGIVHHHCLDPDRVWEEDELSFAGQMADQLAKAFLNQERNQAQQALARSEESYKSLYAQAKREEELYQSLLQSIPDAVAIYNLRGQVQYVNSAFSAKFGYSLEEIKDKRVDFVPEKEAERTAEGIRKVLEGRPVTGMETKRRTKDGRILDISISSSRYYDAEGEPAGIVVILRDITETKRLESELRQAQKMEAVGTLASGIAHDFNNLLQVISSSIQLLKLKRPKVVGNWRYYLEIEDAAGRASSLVKRLLVFGRKLDPVKKHLDLNQPVTDTLPLLKRTIPKMIDLRLRLSEEPLKILGDPTQLEQVLINLVSNAADAMPEGGSITIETGLVELDPSSSGHPAGPDPGNYAFLRVSDTGQGMSADTLSRIFEPFYTTKEVGKGTGLGLAAAYGIVHSHGGHITCASQPGQGAEFTIHLPVHEGEETGEQVREEGGKIHPGGGELILIVDDERPIQEMAAEFFISHGYRVLTAMDSESALKILDANSDAVLALLDLGMPGMGGIACTREMKKRRAGLKIVVASGYAGKNEKAQALEAGADVFLAKPYKFSRLLEMIQKVLADRPDGGGNA